MPSSISFSVRISPRRLHFSGGAEQFVHRQHRVVCRMIGVVAGRPIDHLLAVTHGEVIRDRDGFIVGNEKAVLRARGRAPRTYARIGTRLQQIDRCAAASLVGAAIIRHPCFMGAPAELRRLHALGDEAFHRPGVDEYVDRLWLLRALGVSFGDMNALDAELVGELAPAFPALRLVKWRMGVAGDV